jgi:hypothetical protein
VSSIHTQQITIERFFNNIFYTNNVKLNHYGHHVLEWKPPLKPPVLVIEHPTSVSMGLVVSVVVVCPVGIKDSFVVVMDKSWVQEPEYVKPKK